MYFSHEFHKPHRSHPHHCTHSPKKLAPETYSNMPPEVSDKEFSPGGRGLAISGRGRSCRLQQSFRRGGEPVSTCTANRCHTRTLADGLIGGDTTQHIKNSSISKHGFVSTRAVPCRGTVVARRIGDILAISSRLVASGHKQVRALSPLLGCALSPCDSCVFRVRMVLAG